MQESLSNQVKFLRLQHDLSQEELAQRLQVSRQTVIAIEKGNYVPSLLLAMKIAHTFKKPVEKIFYLS